MTGFSDGKNDGPVEFSVRGWVLLPSNMDGDKACPSPERRWRICSVATRLATSRGDAVIGAVGARIVELVPKTGGVTGSDGSATTAPSSLGEEVFWPIKVGSAVSNIEMMQHRAEPAIITGWENFIDGRRRQGVKIGNLRLIQCHCGFKRSKVAFVRLNPSKRLLLVQITTLIPIFQHNPISRRVGSTHLYFSLVVVFWWLSFSQWAEAKKTPASGAMGYSPWPPLSQSGALGDVLPLRTYLAPPVSLVEFVFGMFGRNNNQPNSQAVDGTTTFFLLTALLPWMLHRYRGYQFTKRRIAI